MDRVDAMTTLLAAVDGGSLSAASRALGAPLATVSRKVADLEAHLGAKLLIRASRGLTLTEAGRAYVAASRRILESIDEAERAASGEYQAPRGHLTLTVPVCLGRIHVEPILLDFLKAYPEVTARLVMSDDILRLVDEHVDVAVRVGRLPDSGMMATRLGLIDWVIAASPAYLAARGTPTRPEDLLAHDCVLFEALYAGTIWRFGRDGGTGDGEAVALPIRPRLAVNTADAAIIAATSGAGITRVLSYQARAAVAAGDLVILLKEFQPEPLPVHLVHLGQSPLPMKLRAFLDFAAPPLKAALGGGGTD